MALKLVLKDYQEALVIFFFVILLYFVFSDKLDEVSDNPDSVRHCLKGSSSQPVCRDPVGPVSDTYIVIHNSNKLQL